MDIERYISTHPKLGALKKGGSRGEYRGPCPFHSNDYNCFSVNANTGFFICRAGSCGVRGSFPLLYKMLEGVASWGEVRNRLQSKIPIRQIDELLNFRGHSKESTIQWIPLPPDIFQSPITKTNFPQWLRDRRGFDERLLELGFDLRIATAGPYRNRILFPFYDIDMNVLTFTARIMGDIEPRYLFPEGSPTNLCLFGVHRIVPPVKCIWVVEGQFDVLRLASYGEWVVGLSTSTMSDRQALDIRNLSKIFQCPVFVMLDRGAWNATQKIWAELKVLGVDAYSYNIDPIAKDPDLLTLDQLNHIKQELYGNTRFQ